MQQGEPPPVMAALEASVASEHFVRWDATRPLTWADFKGQPFPDDAVPQAQANVGLQSQLSCRRGHVDYAVLAVLLPRDSRPVQPVTSDSQRVVILEHEQGHFDIAEIGARRLRTRLEQFETPCKGAEAAFTTLGNGVLAQVESLQARYDLETDHSRDRPEQARWLGWIRAALDSLQAASRPWGRSKD